MRALAGFAAGVLFAIGLGVSGMLRPENVIGFLDFFGEWNPSLLFVMGAALAVHVPAWLWLKRRQPWLSGKMPTHVSSQLDARLFVGAGLFGAGWGLAGICPGPAITIQARPGPETLLFLACLLLGMALLRAIDAATRRPLLAR